MNLSSDKYVLGGKRFSSRLFIGTGKFPDLDTMLRAVRASGAELVTVAIRRFNPGNKTDDLCGPLTRMPGITIVPNTSGARTAAEAIRAAQVGRELTGSPFVKLEIHPNPHHLMPDPIETFEAARKLVKLGFAVLPYMGADPVLAKRLEDAGCAAVMPLGSAIGSGRGLQTSEMVAMIIRDSGIPVIVDAGIRSPSEAAAAMEMGCEAVLVNSAIAAAGDPVAMAEAFALAVRAGRGARVAGIMTRNAAASGTSPLTSFLGGKDSRGKKG
ncbi:MAG: thiazole synthase [bacterium]